MKMTIEQAKRLYSIVADDNWHKLHHYTTYEWTRVCEELRRVVEARSDRAGGKVILWWSGGLRIGDTATKMSRRIRQAWAKMEKEDRA